MKVSVVCPFFNEEAIIEKAAAGMIAALKGLGVDWELIAVNDGSLDAGPERIARVFAPEPNCRLVGYDVNRGRGYALKYGIDQAKGDVVVTTEIDLSWGDDIVPKILAAFREHPGADAVVASPNLPGGGYKNVPLSRVLISRLGNVVIRAVFPISLTMNTGMTRGYRREVIQGLRFEEHGKEFHLEVLLKLATVGSKIVETPAVIEWKDHKLMSPSGGARKSSTKIRKTALRHLNFVVFANPIRLLWGLGVMSTILSIILMTLAIASLLTGRVAVFYAILSFLTGLFALVFFSFGVVTAQNNRVLRELWKQSYTR